MNVHITNHAVAAYQARVRPVPSDVARRELIALVRLAGDPVPELDWKAPSPELGGSYLELTDGVALVLQGDKAVTVVTRGEHYTVVADNRRRHKRQRRADKRREREAKLRASGRHKTARARREREQTSGPGWPD